MDTHSFLFVTLGCAKNEVDTDRMRSLLLGAGYAETQEVEDADVVLVNTCSFLVAATQESLEMTLSLANEVKAGIRERPIIMCGCVPSRYGKELNDELPEVTAFVPVEDEDRIVEIVHSVLGDSAEAPAASQTGVLRTIEGASAYIKISDGCDRFCSFCAIPSIRGPYWSRPAADIAQEAASLLEGGVRELVLIGQDTGVWGSDLPDAPDLADLLATLNRVAEPYGAWIRVLYLQPEGMTERLIRAIRDLPTVLPYIDIPIQHCNARVLDAMRRTGSAEELRALFAHLRQEIPNMVLRTTAMAGFPTETEDEAEELYSFLLEVGFDYTSVFAYSQEDGTAAALMEGQVDEQDKLERTQRLMDLAERLGFEATASHVGEVVDVIVDGIEQNDEGTEMIGHAWFQAPDSDGAVHIAEGEAAVGDVLRCRLTDSFCYELIGEII